jgi:hypothetical protein
MLIGCPLLSCGSILVQYLVVPAERAAPDCTGTGRPVGPPLTPEREASILFEGCYHPRTFEEVIVDRAWQRWMLRAVTASADGSRPVAGAHPPLPSLPAAAPGADNKTKQHTTQRKD